MSNTEEMSTNENNETIGDVSSIMSIHDKLSEAPEDGPDFRHETHDGEEINIRVKQEVQIENIALAGEGWKPSSAADITSNIYVKQESDESGNNSLPEDVSITSTDSDTGSQSNNTWGEFSEDDTVSAKNAVEIAFSRFSRAHDDDLELTVEDCSKRKGCPSTKQTKSKTSLKYPSTSKKSAKVCKIKNTTKKIEKPDHADKSKKPKVIKQILEDVEKSAHQKYKCDACQMKFRVQCSWKSHVCPKREGNLLICQHPGCGKKYDTMKAFRGHAEVHAVYNRGFSLICEICARQFPLRHMLQNHMLKHGDKCDFKCDFPGCEKSFKYPASLRKHQGIHTDKRFICSEADCGKVFTAKSNLKRHMETAHIKRLHTCPHPGCDKTLTTSNGLQEHIEVVHTSVTFPCPVEGCDKVLSSKSTLSRHKRFFHSDIRRFICETCGEAFKQKNALKVHMATHKGGETPGAKAGQEVEEKRRFRCSFEGCNKGYTTRQSLNLHERVHSGERGTFSKAKRFKQPVGSGSSKMDMDLLYFDEKVVSFPL